MAGLKFHWHILFVCLFIALCGITHCAVAPDNKPQPKGPNQLSMNLQFKGDDKSPAVDIPIELEGIRKRRGFWGDTAMYAAAPIVFSVTLFMLKLVVDKIKERSNKQAQLARQKENEAYKARNTQTLEQIGDEIRVLDRIPLWGPGEDLKALELTMELDKLSAEFTEAGSEVLSSLALGLVTRLTDVMTSKQAASGTPIVGMEVETENRSVEGEEGIAGDEEDDEENQGVASGEAVVEEAASEEPEVEQPQVEQPQVEEAASEEHVAEQVESQEAANEQIESQEAVYKGAVVQEPVSEEAEYQNVPREAQAKPESYSQDSAEDNDMPNKDDRNALLEAIRVDAAKGKQAALDAFKSD